MFEVAIKKKMVQLQSVDTDKLQLDGIGDKENFLQQRVGIMKRVSMGGLTVKFYRF